jgi:hypothetical protein
VIQIGIHCRRRWWWLGEFQWTFSPLWRCAIRLSMIHHTIHTASIWHRGMSYCIIIYLQNCRFLGFCWANQLVDKYHDD